MLVYQQGFEPCVAWVRFLLPKLNKGTKLKLTLDELKPGMLIPIYAQVIETSPSQNQLRVKLFSKTDEYTAWVTEKHLDKDWLKKESTVRIEELFDALKKEIDNSNIEAFDKKFITDELNEVLFSVVNS